MSKVTIGSIKSGGNTNVEVADENIIHQTITQITTTTTNFKQEQDKVEFLKQIEELRNTLRQLQAEMQTVAGLDQNTKDEIVIAIMQQVKVLNKAKEEAEKLPSTLEVPTEKHKTLEDYLKSTEAVLNQAKELGEKTAEWTVKLAPYFEKALPLLASVRRLFGIP